jgi:carboxypeptidase family protein
VEDATGAMIPNAQISATEVNKGTEFRGRSNSAGNHVVLNVTPGAYKVTARSTSLAVLQMSPLLLMLHGG